MAKLRHTPGPGVKALTAAIKGLAGQQAKVGWFPSAKYEDGTPVALVAVVQEHGSTEKGIPPRPFMRNTADEKKAEWQKDSHVITKAVIDGKMPADGALQGLAQKAEGDIRRAISKVSTPPLSERTIAARARRHSKGKASTKPLVDTGILLNTLTSQVGKK